ncbi:MAG: M4 family metallopeptidase [Vicingaceae bacterium]|nr:M4 family metallopeptidase [Vicingaceae bacterium]
MNKANYNYLLIFCSYLFFLTTAKGQLANKGLVTAASNGVPTFIEFDDKHPAGSNDAEQVLLSNLANNNPLFSFSKTQEMIDKLGRKHEKYQQYYQNTKVSSGVYNVHYNLDSTIAAINGDYYPILPMSVVPILTEAQALTAALTAVNAQQYAWQNPPTEQWLRTTTLDSTATFYPIGELLIYPISDSLGNTTYPLCYQFNIVTTQPFNSQVVMIDAIQGGSINQYSTFSSAAGDACTRYSGTVAIETTLNTNSNNYELRDATRGGGIVTRNASVSNSIPNNLTTEFEDANDMISPNDWTCVEHDNINKDNAALDAHWAGMMVYDYFKQVHNRDNFNDDSNTPLNIFVHFQGFFGGVAAEWLGTSGSTGPEFFGIALGDGNGTSYDPLVSLDIIAHEFGHGIAQFSSNLLPSNTPNAPETGSINEGLSDIWAAVVENWVVVNGFNGAGDIDKDVWLAGEEVRLDVKAERSLRDPKGFGHDPLSFPIGTSMADTYNGSFFNGLRGKSGVISHWFYLLSEGSAATDEINDDGDPFSIQPIGIEKAADIIYLAQTVYFTPSTNYIGARQATLQAAKDLYGRCSIEAETVVAAWNAVAVPTGMTSGGILACGLNGNGIYDNSKNVNFEVTDDIIWSDEVLCGVPVIVKENSSTVFKAGERIFLGAGFKVERNATFRAYTFECSNAANYRVSTTETTSNHINTKIANYNSTPNLFPNPTSGNFTITQLEQFTGGNIAIITQVAGHKLKKC